MCITNKKSTYCQKVTVHKGPKIPFINNLKKPTCASKRDVLELAILSPNDKREKRNRREIKVQREKGNKSPNKNWKK